VKVVLLYRHEDGRVVEVSGDGSAGEVWQLYPVRELVKKVATLDAAKEHIPAGFKIDHKTFAPPCPKCSAASPMDMRSGMYVCPECSASF
jgi:hypothetical protein